MSHRGHHNLHGLHRSLNWFERKREKKEECGQIVWIWRSMYVELKPNQGTKVKRLTTATATAIAVIIVAPIPATSSACSRQTIQEGSKNRRKEGISE